MCVGFIRERRPKGGAKRVNSIGLKIGWLVIAAIATAAADGGTLTGFTPAILSGGSFGDGRAPLGGTWSV